MNIRALAISACAAGLLLADIAPADARPKPAVFVTESVVSATPGDPAATGVVLRAVRSASRDVTARSAAVTRTTCDGCTSQAVTLQVVMVRNSQHLTVENVANAWSSCRDCGSTSISVQVVVAVGTQGLHAINSAAAVNTECTGCRTTALAFQFALVSDSGPEVAQTGRDLVRQVQAELAGVLPATAEPAADRVQSVLERGLRGRAVGRDVDVDSQ